MEILNTTPVATPMIPGQRFTKEDIPDPKLIQKDKKYRTIVGTLIFYLAYV
jgi:hypothetical protein